MNEQRDPSPIEWIYDAADQAYILIDGPCRSRVWKAPTGLWAAVVSCHGDSATAYDFPLPGDAQTWCEARVAEWRANP